MRSGGIFSVNSVKVRLKLAAITVSWSVLLAADPGANVLLIMTRAGSRCDYTRARVSSVFTT